MQPDISLQGVSSIASLAPCKRSVFKVTFACRIPEALRSNAAGCGAVVGFMRYNKMRRDADAASWAAASTTADDDDSVICIRHEDHALLSPHLVGGTSSGSSSVRASTPAKTPISNDDVDDERSSDDAGYGFEANRRIHALEFSRDSSWVLASPCHSCGWATPASVRRSASCTTNDAATEPHSASDDDDDMSDGENNGAHANDQSAAPPSDWDLMLPHSPQHPAFGAKVRRHHPVAIPIRFLKPM
ncbi:Hypothetical protein, putative [Bodo saltans]|uniref:Uncharacterized protein n=1 Tax=Bodo saltans TaxID=75058 RepID=A0A0S4JB27_BODSA|nr:Hypothetical protein, putative [Bodo saltans]|eukprot:CUG87364.1 Hypothetical protein, putative [Bodo saltans]